MHSSGVLAKSCWVAGLCLVLGAGLVVAEVLDRIVAVVDQRPVFLSEVRVVQSLRGLDHAQACEGLIDEILMYDEARRYLAARPTRDEEGQALASLSEQRLAVDPDVLADLARRQATILKYVQLRFAPLVHVEETEVERAYQDRWAGVPEAPSLAVTRHDLLAEIGRQRLDERIEEWVAQLREAATIRYNTPTPVP